MIITLLFYLGGLFLSLISTLLATLTFAIPSVFTTAIQGYISYLGYAQGIVPVVATTGYSGLAGSIGLLDLFGYALAFLVIWYSVKIILWLFALLPWIGKHVPMPHAGGNEKAV